MKIDDHNPQLLPSLFDIYSKHEGKLSDKWESYLYLYDKLFKELRDKPINLLEIGVQNGGSLEIWAKYFYKALHIMGCEINREAKRLGFTDSRISLIIGDINELNIRREITQKNSFFDVIIDDGSHSSQDIVRSFYNYFPLLKNDGIYIVEDLHCSYWPEFEGGLFNPLSSMQFFKSLADIVNYEHWGIPYQIGDFLKSFENNFGIRGSLNIFSSIHSITFGNSTCVVRKTSSDKNFLGYRMVVGNDSILADLKPFNHTFSIPPELSSEIILAQSPVLQIEKLKQTLSAKETTVSDLSKTLQDREGQIAELTQTVAIREARISDLSKTLQDREGQIAELKILMKDKDSQLSRLNLNLQSILGSTSYQLSRHLIKIGKYLPLPLKRGIRRSAKAAYWILTPHKMLERLSQIKIKRLENKFKFNGLIDRNWYLQRYPDVAERHQDPVNHYLIYGFKEGRDPSPLFDTDWYLSQNPDVAESGVNPLQHYMEYGVKEGRDPSPLFDTDWYLSQNPDVAESGVNPLQHFLDFGQKEKRNQVKPDYSLWIQNYDTLNDTDREVFRKAMEGFTTNPLISVVMPVYNTPKELLVEAIESVRNQIYPHWELCISDNASTLPEVRKILEEYLHRDKRIHVIFRDHNEGISVNSNSALSLASGNFIALLDSDDLLSEDALFWVVSEINLNPEVEIIYSDEDKLIREGNQWKRCDFLFKPDFSLHFILTHNMNCLNHLGVYKHSLVNEVGGFNKEFDGVQDLEIALRMVERVSPKQIRHIPRILYHWRIIPTSTSFSHEAKPNIIPLCREAIQSFLNRNFPGTKVLPSPIHPGFRKIKYQLPTPSPLVSILLPTGGGYEILKKCLDSINCKTIYENYEILIDNGCEDDNVMIFLEDIERNNNIRIIRKRRPKNYKFNYSALINSLAREAKGKILVLLNDDVEVINEDWLNELVSFAIRPEIGCVGAKLYYPDETIQHGGVVLGINGCCDHAFARISRNSYGYQGYLLTTREVSAVTGAVLAVKSDLFWKVRGLNEKDLKVAFNDVDLCLSILNEGYINIWNPYVELYHYESFTRGFDSDEPGESNYIIDKWKNIIISDPFYNPNLSLKDKIESYSLAFPPRISKIPK